jgi:two-component system, OmpR family, alkaline phosphatase synthesis response regulator PhoP
MKRIAVIEDDSDIGFIIRLNLEREGYGVTLFEHGQEGLTAVQRGGFDFVILDLNLPDLDGFTICRELRREPQTQVIPIMMLTARGSERDRVTGLELGADDYLSKPFSVRELVARVAAILRRTRLPSEESSRYQDGEISIDERSFRVHKHGTEVKLARKEFELLWLLVRHKSSVISRERILSEVWHMSDEVETRTVDVHIRNLRKKIGAERISTVVGFGYRYDPPQDSR